MASGHEINVPSWSQLRRKRLNAKKENKNEEKKLDPRQMTG